jgi:ATP-binding cassette subfamily B protein
MGKRIASSVTADADSSLKPCRGYDTIVDERVQASPAGEQRISLAALCKRAPLLILDDTTSAVDIETEQYIQEELRKGLSNPPL